MPPKNRDVERLLKERGFHLKAQSGSHHHFENVLTGVKVTIVGNPSDEMKRSTLYMLLESAGVEKLRGW